ncbi:MAG: hypothetical protein ACRDJ9_35070 [Dehalococcoidia bacterium]
MSEAFPRRPAPRHAPPTAEEIRRARKDFALHIPSLVNRRCLAEDCGEWPCPPWRNAVPLLDRAGLLDIDGRLRDPQDDDRHHG